MLAEAGRVTESPSPGGNAPFRVGERCRIAQLGSRDVFGSIQFGTIRFIGSTEFSPGDWFGVELDEPTGKNDGSVNGVQYFRCQPAHGIFVKASLISKEVDGLTKGDLAPELPAEHRASVSRKSGRAREMRWKEYGKRKSLKASSPSTEGLPSDASLASPKVCGEYPSPPLKPVKKSIALGDEPMPTCSLREPVRDESVSAQEISVQRESGDVRDTDGIREALPQRNGLGFVSRDIRSAQKAVGFEMPHSEKELLHQVETVSNAVSELAGAVQAAEVRAAEVQALSSRVHALSSRRAANCTCCRAKAPAKGPSQTPATSSNSEPTPGFIDRSVLSKFLETFEHRVWAGIERRVDAAVRDAVARARQDLAETAKRAPPMQQSGMTAGHDQDVGACGPEKRGWPDSRLGNLNIAPRNLVPERSTGEMAQESSAAAPEGFHDSSPSFLVELDRSNGASLGIKVDPPVSASLGCAIRIKSIDPLGLFGTWNTINPSLPVCCGDWIVEVNGICGADISTESQKQGLMRFKIARSGQGQLGDMSEDVMGGTQRHFRKWKVSIDRSDGLALGLIVNSVNLVVEYIPRNGLISEWNNKHPTQAIRPGDQIVGVNGFCTAPMVIAECNEQRMLSICVQRRLAPSCWRGELPRLRAAFQRLPSVGTWLMAPPHEEVSLDSEGQPCRPMQEELLLELDEEFEAAAADGEAEAEQAAAQLLQRSQLALLA